MPKELPDAVICWKCDGRRSVSEVGSEPVRIIHTEGTQVIRTEERERIVTRHVKCTLCNGAGWIETDETDRCLYRTHAWFRLYWRVFRTLDTPVSRAKDYTSTLDYRIWNRKSFLKNHVPAILLSVLFVIAILQAGVEIRLARLIAPFAMVYLAGYFLIPIAGMAGLLLIRIIAVAAGMVVFLVFCAWLIRALS